MSDLSAAGASSLDSSVPSIAGSSPSDKVPAPTAVISRCMLHRVSCLHGKKVATVLHVGDKQHLACRCFGLHCPPLSGWCAGQVGQLQSSVEHELYSDKGPIADRHEHPARTSSMGHATDIKRSIYLHRQRQMTAMTLRAMGGRAIKRTHSVCDQTSRS